MLIKFILIFCKKNIFVLLIKINDNYEARVTTNTILGL